MKAPRWAAEGGSGVSRRRFMLASAAGCWAAGARGAGATAPARTGMGIVAYAMGIRQRAEQSLRDPLAFLDACRRAGAGGMQVSLGARDAEYCSRLRAAAEKDALFIEAIIELTADAAQVDRVERQVRTAKAAGADLARVVVMPGRRYEQFASMDEFAAASKTAMRMLELAEPIAAKHKFQLAVENHKDHRVGERLDMLRRLGSEHVGICVDVGNSFALCEDPMEVVRAFAPLAMTVHLKDQAVREHAEGFVYGDAALGDGFLDLGEMVAVLRKARPRVRFCLEAITRDPLLVPVFTEKYWTTMGPVAAAELARTMRTVRLRAATGPLPTISNLPVDQQVAAEARTIARSVAYARDKLHL